MPLNMAVEEPNSFEDESESEQGFRVPCKILLLTRVIGFESEHKVATRSNGNSVSPHRSIRISRMISRIKVTCILIAAVDDLKCMAVQMERVFPFVIVVQNNIDNAILVQNMRICVGTVD